MLFVGGGVTIQLAAGKESKSQVLSKRQEAVGVLSERKTERSAQEERSHAAESGQSMHTPRELGMNPL